MKWVVTLCTQDLICRKCAACQKKEAACDSRYQDGRVRAVLLAFFLQFALSFFDFVILLPFAQEREDLSQCL